MVTKRPATLSNEPKGCYTMRYIFIFILHGIYTTTTLILYTFLTQLRHSYPTQTCCFVHNITQPNQSRTIVEIYTIENRISFIIQQDPLLCQNVAVFIKVCCHVGSKYTKDAQHSIINTFGQEKVGSDFIDIFYHFYYEVYFRKRVRFRLLQQP